MQPSTHNSQPSTSDESEVLVRVNGVSKKFCRDLKKSLWYGVMDVASEVLPFSSNKEQGTKKQEHSSSLRPGEFWANKDISFELRRGECIGLIGRNGAGKTTLLKILNGLIKPDEGRIEMRGRVGALIALGAGFNPILTGRENIYVNGSILGLTREEIDDKIDEIIEFAEIDDFIDSPVQSYSSGMQVRLGFAVATALDPDVLILDEVLAVGDVSFRNKCYARIGELLNQCAVIFVTHNMAHISRMCSSALVLSKGQPIFSGEVDEGVAKYNELNEARSDHSSSDVIVSQPVTDVRVTFASLEIKRDDNVEFRIECESTKALKSCFFYMYVFDSGEQIVAQWSSKDGSPDVDLKLGNNQYQYAMGPIRLRGGNYKLSLVMKDSSGIKNLIWCDMSFNLLVENHFFTEAIYQIPNIGTPTISS